MKQFCTAETSPSPSTPPWPFAAQHDAPLPACERERNSDLCEWEFDAGDDSVGAPWGWTCKTCGAVDNDRDPPSDPDADAYERNL